MKNSYCLGICPNNLNGNHIAWCHSIESFESREDRDARADELWEEVAGTCDTVWCWEEEAVQDQPVLELCVEAYYGPSDSYELMNRETGQFYNRSGQELRDPKEYDQ